MQTDCFASFWHGGSLSPYELSCFKSFTVKECDFVLYSYDKVDNLPSNVMNVDAREILHPDALNQFLVAGVPSVAHFSDYFRYIMFQKTSRTWVDTDVMLLRNFDFEPNTNILGKETDDSINNAVLRLTNIDPRLAELVRKVESYVGLQMEWGDTGPKILSEIYRASINKSALPPRAFYPIHYDDYYKVFLPEFHDECETSCQNAFALHLWNNRIIKLGVWKKIGPPKNSFLYSRIQKCGAEGYFTDFYPEEVVRIMARNAVFNNASLVTALKKIVGYMMPSVYNSVRRRVLRVAANK